MRSARWLLLASLLALPVAPADASTITYRAEATVYWAWDVAPIEEAIGTPLVLTFSVDSASEDRYPDDPRLSWFSGAVFDVTIEAVGSVFAMPDYDVNNGVGLDLDGDYGDWFHMRRSFWYGIGGGWPPPPGSPHPTRDGDDVDMLWVDFDVEDHDALLFPHDALPTRSIAVSRAEVRTIDFRWSPVEERILYRYVAEVTRFDVVPEPPTAGLVWLGLSGLALASRRPRGA